MVVVCGIYVGNKRRRIEPKKNAISFFLRSTTPARIKNVLQHCNHHQKKYIPINEKARGSKQESST